MPSHLSDSLIHWSPNTPMIPRGQKISPLLQTVSVDSKNQVDVHLIREWVHPYYPMWQLHR